MYRKRKPTTLEKLAKLRESCNPHKLYRARKLAKILGLNLPNARRYLRRMEYLGFINVYKYKRRKWYRVPSVPKAMSQIDSVKENGGE